MAMNLDQVNVSEAIDQTSRCYFADTTKVVGVNCVNIAPIKLLGAGRDAVEHLIVPIKEMNRTENKIEFIPIFLDPLSSRCRVNRIVVQLDARPDF